MQGSVVIGANYGDEGKGLMTDYLCRKHAADLVVRFNGGAQAGHTVETPDGRRHVFQHIGSGYFAGVPTYLSKFFVSNPILFRQEYQHLDIPSSYNIFVDPKSQITTPFDMIANQIKERHRGASRHGSCGVGFGETLDRVEDEGIYLTYADLTRAVQTNDWQSVLDTVRVIAEWWAQSLAPLARPDLEDLFSFLTSSETMTGHFLSDLQFFVGHTIETKTLPSVSHIIFEGAQGLALDQHMGNFPYVTRSNTGIQNVIDLQRQFGFDLTNIVYVTRSYLTRHGADPYFKEEPFPASVYDTTNVPHSFQGTLRYSRLSFGDVQSRIRLDMRAHAPQYMDAGIVQAAVTHLDQIDAPIVSMSYRVSGSTHLDVKEV